MCTFVLPVLQCVGVFRKMKTSGLCSQWLTLRGLLSVFPHIFVQGSCFLICIPPPPPPPPPPPSCHTPCFTPSLTHHFVTPSFTHTTQLCHTPSLSHCHHLSHTIFHTPHTTHHLSHTTLSHTILSHTIFHIPSLTHHFVTHHLSPTIFRTPLCHPPSFTHHFVTHHSFTHRFVTHTIFHTQFCHPPSFTHNLCHKPSFTLCHTMFVTHHLSHTTLPHTIFQSFTHQPRHFAWQPWHLMTSTWRTWARLGAGDAAQLGDTRPGFAGQAWHLVTSTFVLRGRRGTYSTGLALVARLGALGRTWALVAGDAAVLCVAGVALGDVHLRFAWQAWHLATCTFVSRGRCGACCLVARLGVLGRR